MKLAKKWQRMGWVQDGKDSFVRETSCGAMPMKQHIGKVDGNRRFWRLATLVSSELLVSPVLHESVSWLLHRASEDLVVSQVRLLKKQLLMVSMLASEKPLFFNPLYGFEAQNIRDQVLAHMESYR